MTTAAAGVSALVVAAHSNHGDLGAFLLSRGADPNAAGAGYTALQAAVLRGNLDLVKALLASGADPERPDHARHARSAPRRRLQHPSPDEGRERVLARRSPGSARHHAASWPSTARRPQRFRTIPRPPSRRRWVSCAVASPRTARGGTACPCSSTARKKRRTLAASKLAVQMGVDVNAVDTAGETALHDAARQRFDTVIQFLADSGANLNVRNKRNQTPLGVLLTEIPEAPPGTESLNRQSTVDLLRKLGATE